MIKLKISSLLLYISSILLVSCEEVLNVSIEEEGNTVIVNSAFIPNEPISFEIYKSIPVTNADFRNIEAVDGASIILYENGVTVDEIMQKSSAYQSDFIPQEGKDYSFLITLSDSKKLSGQSYIPKAVKISSSAVTFDRYNNNVKINMRFTDPAETENFYLFTLTTLYKQMDGSFQPYDFNSPWIYAASDFSVVEKNIFPDGKRGLLFSDKLIDGKEYELVLTMWSDVIKGNSPYSTCKICLQLSSISKDLYLYGKSFVEQNASGMNPFDEYFNVYSNIENGLGIFAGYSTSFDTLTYRWGD